ASSMLAAATGVLVYVWAGPWLILLNNRLMRSMGFPYPIALAAVGVGCWAVVSQLLIRLRLVESEPPRSTRFLLMNALPIAVFSALTLGLGNAAYIHLSVAACQILKTLTPAITLALLFLLRIEAPSARELACVLFITVGAILASQGGLELAPFGLFLQVCATSFAFA
ncbi:MAG: hypothetical protein SGPRY_014747, partial [Prymnesium sp.]